MNAASRIALTLTLVLTPLAVWAQTGPFDPESWPATRDPGKKVHYVVTDGGLEPPSGTWLPGSLQVLTGGDQVTQAITIGGHAGTKVTGNYLNLADTEFTEWADDPFIDILLQVYGDDALFDPQGQPRDFAFQTGVLPELKFPVGGQVPVGAKNKKWNWVLFRIPNGQRPSDGSLYVGSIPANAQGGYQYGGVNGGTIRFETVPNLIVRVVAFGEEGAFGPPEEINKFFPPETCDPEPNTNLAEVDLASGTTNHLVVLNDVDQPVTFESNVGPVGDLRRAVRPMEEFLNFGVTDYYLGKPCNDVRAVKICVDFYDDPSFAGMEPPVRFGPEAYATDDKGGTAVYPEDQRQVLTGSGAWIRRSWTIPSVCLQGVKAGAFTAGPRLISESAQVAVSRFALAVLRSGDHPLAGQDPLADCYADPKICTEAYGSYVELDLGQGIKNGLDVGTSSGDQEMIQAEAGPANDRRLAIRPAREDGTPGFTHQYLNFAIQNEALGPSSQPPAHLAVCVTYYDDPELIGLRFRPEVYVTERNGNRTLGFTPDTFFVAVAGSGEWRRAYWEIPDIKFIGVNQGPQAAARFVLEGKVFFTSVRYAVIRPCGPNAGVNAVAECKPPPETALSVSWSTNNTIRLSWPAEATGFTAQAAPTLVPAGWQDLGIAPIVDGTLNVITVPIGPTTTFYRLRQP